MSKRTLAWLVVGLVIITILIVLLCARCRKGENPGGQDPVADVDIDDDGVRDDKDKCIGTATPAGSARPQVDASGCSVVVSGAACRGDQAPPRVLLGSAGGTEYRLGAEARLVTTGTKRLLRVQTPGDMAADVIEACPSWKSVVTIVGRLGQKPFTWSCRGDEIRETLPGLGAGGRVAVGLRTPCLFDFAAFSITPAEVDAARTAGQIELLLTLHVEDGAKNRTRSAVGDGRIARGKCGVRFIRTTTGVPSSVEPLDCEETCDFELLEAPPFTGNSNPFINVSPSIAPPKAGTDVLTVVNRTVGVRQYFQLKPGSACDLEPVNWSAQALVTKLNVAGNELVTSEQPMPCNVTGLGQTSRVEHGWRLETGCGTRADKLDVRGNANASVTTSVVVTYKNSSVRTLQSSASNSLYPAGAGPGG